MVKARSGNFLFYFILLDLVILPVTRFYGLSISLLICLYYVFTKKGSNKYWLAKYFLFLVVLSTAIGLFTKTQTVILQNISSYSILDSHIEDIKRCAYLLFAYFYFRTVRIIVSDHQIEKKALHQFIWIYVALFLLLYGVKIINPQGYYVLRNMLYGQDISMGFTNELIASGYYSRYSFVFLDPNSSGYISMALIILMIEYTCKRERIIYYLLLALIPVLTLSTGNIFALGIYFLVKLISKRKNLTHSKRSIYTIAVIAVAAAFLLVQQSAFVQNIAVIDRMENNSMSGRFAIYADIFNKLKLPIIGQGYVIAQEGNYVRPHSDHLRILYGYGILAYLCALKIILNKKLLTSKYYFLIPIWIAFTINSAIDEIRILFLLSSVIGFLVGQETTIPEEQRSHIS